MMSMVFGTGLTSLCLLSLAASLLTIPTLAWLCREWTGELRPARVATAVSCMTFACFPHWIWLGTSMLAEPLYTPLFVVTLIAFLKADKEGSLKWAVLAVALAALSSLARLEGAALTAIVCVLLVWRLRKKLSATHWAILTGAGLLLTIAFPIARVLSHSGGNHTALSYFERLKGCFTSQYAHSVLRTPWRLFVLYGGVSPLYAFLMLTGFFCAKRLRQDQTGGASVGLFATAITLYIAAQCIASALGMMPTHNFWRLTVPVYAAALPFLGVTFAVLLNTLSIKALILPALFCALYQLHSYPNPPVFITSGVYESGKSLQETLTRPDAPQGKTLIEVAGWDWLALALIGKGPDFTGLEFDRTPYHPAFERMDNVKNPTIFSKPEEELKAFLNERNITHAAVISLKAGQTLTKLDWKAKQNTPYIILEKP